MEEEEEEECEEMGGREVDECRVVCHLGMLF
jgi:hypothetical protein